MEETADAQQTKLSAEQIYERYRKETERIYEQYRKDLLENMNANAVHPVPKLPGQLPLTREEIAERKKAVRESQERLKAWDRKYAPDRERKEKEFPGGELHGWDKSASLHVSLDSGDPNFMRASLYMSNDQSAWVSAPLPPPSELVKFIRALVVRYNHAVAQMNSDAAQCVPVKLPEGSNGSRS